MDSLSGIDDLLAAARSGDNSAENQLFSQLRARILGLVQQRIWNDQRHAAEIRHDAENLTQDICLVVLEKYKTASFHLGFMPWVFQIARYKIGEYYRKPKGEAVEENDEKLQLAIDPNPTEQLIDSEALDGMIARALEKMSRRCRTIVEALLQEEIKAYIAEQRLASTPVNTIYGNIHRCRERFQKLLRREGFER